MSRGEPKPRPTRRQFGAHVRLAVGDSREVRWRLAANLSSGGMFVRDQAPAAVGTTVLVEFVLPDERPLSRVAAKVVHVRSVPEDNKPVGMGLQFVEFDENARSLVQAFRQHAERTEAEKKMRARAQAESQVARKARPFAGSRERQVENLGQRSNVAAEIRGTVIGIDLGTTNSCAAVFRDGKAEVISSPEGYQTVPSVVFVESPTKVFVGHAASQKMLLAPDRAIYGSKRFIGRPFGSQEVKTYGHFFRYGLVADDRGLTAARLGDRVIPLEAVAALILRHIQSMVATALGQDVRRCVITVPAYFGETQRRAVFQAGEMAGFTVERVLSEPTAAAVAYGYGRGLNKYVVVYDMGGGTFDASVLRIAGESMEVLATDGDSFLGGSDFDDRLTEYLCAVVERTHRINIRKDPTTVQRVRLASEMAKQHLSQQSKATVNLPYFAQTEAGPLSFHYAISREEYERLTEDLVVRSIGLVDDLLRRAGIRGRDVDEIITAGGQSRCPQIHRLLTERFGKKPSMRVHPDHAIAMGAAIVAAAAHGKAQVSLTDILPASLRIACDDSTAVLLKRGAPLPARTSFRLEATDGVENEFSCHLYRGEADAPSGNELLGALRLPATLAEAVSGTTATVSLEVGADGLLTLAMRHPTSGEVKRLQLSLADGVTTDQVDDDFELTVVE